MDISAIILAKTFQIKIYSEYHIVVFQNHYFVQKVKNHIFYIYLSIYFPYHINVWETVGAIGNGPSRHTDNIGHTRHSTKTNKAIKPNTTATQTPQQNRECSRMVGSVTSSLTLMEQWLPACIKSIRNEIVIKSFLLLINWEVKFSKLIWEI